ncbi:MAG: 16S rRNA (cytosine(1402)-N(4))-methyltransferase RsmH [Planctomycetota bacterium]
MTDFDAPHRAVLLAEVVHWLDPPPGARLLDLTVGAGGHARALLDKAGPAARLWGVDRDLEILAVARARLTGLPVELLHGDFGDVERLRAQLPAERFDSVLLDLGVSSLQLDAPQRGFSFRSTGPLDMRMDQSRGITASEFLQAVSCEELTRLLADVGEERFAPRVARAIDDARRTGPITTTTQLAEIVRAALRGRPSGGIDPATRTFQALRIAVNRELVALDMFLARFKLFLRPQGRLAIIAFHSLEDRRVKQCFREQAHEGDATLVTPSAIRPSASEVAQNPRARSARLRVIALHGD